MVNSMCIYTAASAGAWTSNGLGTGYAGSLPTVSFRDNITAFAGGGQGSATPLLNCLNRVTVVATIADSVLLPPSAGGLSISVANAAVNAVAVFPASGDAINGAAINTAFSVPGGSKTAQFVCSGSGNWHSILSA
jgi:hypothetical protein